MEIKETLNSYREYAAEWSTNAQAAQRQLDREISQLRRKIKSIESETPRIEQRWVERLLTGAASVRRPPRHAEKCEGWRTTLELLKPLQRVGLALSQEKYEFSALISSCEKTIEFFKESQERLEKFQALVASFPEDKGFSAQAENEAMTVKKRREEMDGQLSRMARLLADARKRNLVRS